MCNVMLECNFKYTDFDLDEINNNTSGMFNFELIAEIVIAHEGNTQKIIVQK